MQWTLKPGPALPRKIWLPQPAGPWPAAKVQKPKIWPGWSSTMRRHRGAFEVTTNDHRHRYVTGLIQCYQFACDNWGLTTLRDTFCCSYCEWGITLLILEKATICKGILHFNYHGRPRWYVWHRTCSGRRLRLTSLQNNRHWSPLNSINIHGHHRWLFTFSWLGWVLGLARMVLKLVGRAGSGQARFKALLRSAAQMTFQETRCIPLDVSVST